MTDTTNNGSQETFPGTCPKCGLGLELPVAYIGQKGECPTCGEQFTVQRPGAAKAKAPAASSASRGAADDITPDSLMHHFKGKGIMPILIFTVVVHVVVVIGSSVPYLVKSAFGPDNSKRSEEDRIKSAVEDATAALKKIAKDHGLNPQDISSQFASGGSRTAAADAPKYGADATTPKPERNPETTPERVKSAYETNLERKVEGPKEPTFNNDPDDSIF